jgi:hypothetical protein
MTKQEELFDRLIAMLQVAPALPERTLAFKETSHQELCRAFSSWFNQLQLLFGEPVQVSLTHRVQEEGVYTLPPLALSFLRPVCHRANVVI